MVKSTKSEVQIADFVDKQRRKSKNAPKAN